MNHNDTSLDVKVGAEKGIGDSCTGKRTGCTFMDCSNNYFTVTITKNVNKIFLFVVFVLVTVQILVGSAETAGKEDPVELDSY